MDRNMSDIHILELLSSKICHDLISPIGAINNGVELLGEMGADSGAEVTDLIAYSAQQASGKLQAYRMAYGAGGADANLKPEDVYNTFQAFIGGNEKLKQDWNPRAPLGPDPRPKGYCKILMACLLQAADCLPKGGVISIASSESGGTSVKASGTDAAFKGDNLAALSLNLPQDKLDPKNIHAYVTGLMTKAYGFKISTQEEKGRCVTVTLS